MALKDEITAQCDAIFSSKWKERDGTKVPAESDLTYANDGINLECAVLYADLSASTTLVDQKTKQFAAEIYKTFLYCAGRIIRSEGGDITAYDGDRIMAVFPGLNRTKAVRAALKINWAVKNIVQPRMKAVYKNSEYVIKHTCGVDFSKLMVAKTGVRGANDLVWVGRAANYAAKLCDLPNDTPTWITSAVYDGMLDEVKYANNPKRDMWSARSWTAMDNQRIYCSSFWWSFT